jgi:hypothetical protein
MKGVHLKLFVGWRSTMRKLGIVLMLVVGAWLRPDEVHALDSVCARVKIEIKQELTLERQAFDAHMRITNGLSHISLENLRVTVSFADADGSSVLASSDPDNTDALFFIRLDSMENIDDVGGAGIVEPDTAADIHWLIIPAPGASNGLERGTLYYVAATLSYSVGGEEKTTEVTPDYIFVKPMPELALDYFLPTDVYGDDAFTTQIEPPVPFSLGVRVRNSGHGAARNVKIESAQPKIVENEQGLLIGFAIEGSQVNEQPAGTSLLVDLGDIDPNRCATARWIMSCTLSGRFVEFNAGFSHADELGGQLTSLVTAADTHLLVHDVLVDAAGRDAIRDFLAQDGDVVRVYESEGTDTEVADQSAAAVLQMSGNSGSLSTPVTAGFMLVRLPDPFSGTKALTEVRRSDGKLIKAENVWLSRTRTPNLTWHYFVNLFDANSTDRYQLSFADMAASPLAPVLLAIADQSVVEGRALSFVVDATDPNGTTPRISAAPLPAGAGFSDQGNGSGFFDWVPAVGQAGRYEIVFTASDGVLEASRRVAITVASITDTDGDGLPDSWEMEHFGTLDYCKDDDVDGDGLSNWEEFENHTEPSESNAPSVPQIVSPADGGEVQTFEPQLLVEASTDPDGDVITYSFELYADEQLTNLIAAGTDQTELVWTVPSQLSENRWYHWRVRASDGAGFSAWSYGRFFVNTQNEAPLAFLVSRPQDLAEVDVLTPVLEVTNSRDPDNDAVTYGFDVYADDSLNLRVSSAAGLAAGAGGSTSWQVQPALADNTRYWWKATATDEHGARTETQLVSFFVNTANDAPGCPVPLEPAPGSEVSARDLSLVVHNASDPDGDSLTYIFELDKVETFDSSDLWSSGELDQGPGSTTSCPISGLSDNTRYHWRVKATDGFAESPWSAADFFVNTVNDPPSAPTLKNPGDGSWVNTLKPVLEVNAATDADQDVLYYTFEIYADEGLSQLLSASTLDEPVCSVDAALADNTRYWWRARAEDEHGAVSNWTAKASFFTDSNGINDPPAITILEPAAAIHTSTGGVTIGWQDSDPDSNAEISLYYDTDAAGQDGVLIVDGLREDPDGSSDTFLWDVTNLAEGTYHIYGTITDGNSSMRSFAAGTVTITKSPAVRLDFPQPGLAVQDWTRFQAAANDDSAVESLFFYLREADGGDGAAIGQEDLPAVFNGTSGIWEFNFDTTVLPDGYYVLMAKAVDIHGNEGWDEGVAFSIRNWAVIDMLPDSKRNQPGRTMPVKFSLRLSEEVDPAQSFVTREDLEIRILASDGTLLQTSRYGDGSTNYRIDSGEELYITNFKTSKTPDIYSVEVRRLRNDFLLGGFTFETVTK